MWLALGVLIILSPLGLIATGTAFGEWSKEELLAEVGFIPAGLEKFADMWKYVLLPDYSIPGLEGPLQSAFGYIFSAVIGVALVVAVIMMFSRIVRE